MAATALLLCACAFLTILLIKTYFLKRKVSVNLPPIAAGALPIVGHTFSLLTNRDRLYELVFKTMLGPALKNGQEAGAVRIGTWELFVLLDPDDSFLMVNSSLKKDKLYEFFKPCFGEGLITADAPVWKRHRKLLNPTFNQSVLDSYVQEFSNKSQELVESFAHQVGKGLFNPLPYAKRTILQIVCATIMGLTVEDEAIVKETGLAFETFTSCMVERIRKFWNHNDFLFSLSSLKKKQDAAVTRFKNLSYKVIRKKKSELTAEEEKNTSRGEATVFKDTSKPQFKSLLDLLLELSKDGTLTESEIQGEVNTFIAAAFDTTYHTLCSTLLTLGSYPEVQKKVYEEQQEVFKETSHVVERQHLSKLKYLEAVIKETLRLYPVVVAVGRILDQDIHLKKYTLPAGSRCFASIYHICRHPVWGPDAEQFRPERWLDGSLPSNARAYAVFGLGRRSCIGSNYAMMLIKTALSHVVRQYHISGDVTQLVQKLDIVVTPVSGHHITIEQRRFEELKPKIN